MNMFSDIYKFIECLSFIDIVFFTAILALMILLVTLIYFIKINKDVLDTDDFFPPSKDIGKKEEESIESINKNIIENKEVKKEERISSYDDEEGELLDLESLTKKLKEEEQSDRISFTEYEKDQEEKAIISYEELLKRHNKYAINYEKEEIMDDLIVKKVNLNDLVNKDEVQQITSEVRVISYQKEEAFLAALKELNSLLY